MSAPGWWAGIRGQMQRHERLVAVSIGTGLMMTGSSVVGPVLPLFAREFGASITVIGTAVSAFGLARLILNIPLGALSDRWGRRFLLVGGPLVFAVSMVGAGLAGGVTSLITWRFVSGAGSAMYMTGAIVYVADISDPSNRARLIGVNQAAGLAGQSLGPGLGGLIGAQFGLRAPFFFIAGAALVAAVHGAFRLEETRPERAQGRPPQDEAGRRPRAWSTILASPMFRVIAAVNFAIFFSRAATRQILIPLASVEVFGFSLAQVGVLLTAIAIVNLALLPPATVMADRLGGRRVLGPAMLLMAASLVLFGIAGSVGVFFAGAAVLALASTATSPVAAAIAADDSDETTRGFALGMFRTAGDLGLLVGPPALGLVTDLFGFGWGFGAAGLVIATAGLLFMVAARAGTGRGSRA